METLDISTTQYKRCDYVKAIGRIDSYTAPDLEATLKKIMDAGTYKIVFEMSEVNFISSKGLWVLIEAQKACKRYNRGELVLVNVPDNISNTLDLIGMRNYFTVYDDVTAAVASF